jgi:hypothetical protein
MKYINKKSFFIVLVTVLVLGNSGCKKLEDFGDTDIRTDAATSPITAYLLSNAQISIANLFQPSVNWHVRGNLYAQQWSETQYTDISRYGNPQLEAGTTYRGPLMDLQKVINMNTDPATQNLPNVIGSGTSLYGSNGNQIAIATINKVYYLWTTTDRWGDVPYTDALQGTANPTPSYDKQEDIYPQLLQDLKDAMASFDGGNKVSGDIFFSEGDAAEQEAHWKKVANSLRMLIALRMSKVFPSAGGFAATEFAAAYNDPAGAIEDNEDNWIMDYAGGTAAQTNMWYGQLNGRRDYALSLTIGDILENMDDPRRDVYGSPGAEFPYGLPRDEAVAFDGSVNGNYSQPFDPSVRTASSPIYILPASYVLLAEAEAAERGWITADAEALYNAGVIASFEQWGLTSADAMTYLSGAADFNSGSGGGNNIGFDAAYPSIVGSDAITTTPLERIQLQQYLAMFGDGVQVWSNWRRTGVPNLVPTAYASNSPAAIPRRLTYGTNDYATNPAKVAEAAARLSGGDVMTARMWWDQ